MAFSLLVSHHSPPLVNIQSNIFLNGHLVVRNETGIKDNI